MSPNLRRSGPFVLTVNVEDSRSQELMRLIDEVRVCVFVTAVRGFGQPELRIGSHDYVRGITAIKGLLQKSNGGRLELPE